MDFISKGKVSCFNLSFWTKSKVNIYLLFIPNDSQVICGTDPYPKNFRAKKYKIKEKFFTKADFQLMMRNLPVPVSEEEINEMFDFADKDKDGKINYR